MTMEKLKKCRICLVENVRMYVVANKNLQEIYEKLADVPFVTEDRRPMLACFFCCAKLKQCHRLLRQCLEAEKLFAQMMNEDYECNPLINQEVKGFSGFIKSPTENISIVDVVQPESIAVKEELSAACEGLDDIIKPKEEHQSEDLEPDNLDNSFLDVANIQPQHSDSDLEDDVPLCDFKIEVEEDKEAFTKKRRTVEMKRATVAKKPKLGDATTAEQKKKSDSKVIRTTQKRTSKPDTYFKEPYKCVQRSFNPVKKIIQHTVTQLDETPYKCDVCQRSFAHKCVLTTHIRVHTGEKPFKCDICQSNFRQKSHLTSHIRKHTGETPYKCDVCQRRFRQNSHLTSHIRKHTGETPYKCDICERSFSRKFSIATHKRIHTGERPYKCDLCQRSFSEKRTLTNHIRIHTGEKPYKCDTCQRSFSQKSSLTKHIRLHTAEKP